MEKWAHIIFVCMPLDVPFLKYSQPQGVSPIANSHKSFVVSYARVLIMQCCRRITFVDKRKMRMNVLV
jgi:hypothetical protein